MSGTNVGDGNYVDPGVLKARGYRLVRIWSTPAADAWAQQCLALGIAVVAMVDPNPNHGAGYATPYASVHQFDNERDMDQSPAEYQANATFYQRTYPSYVWISCGMSSGNPAWWQGVQQAGGLPGFSGFAVHPYNKTPQEAKALLQSYQQITPNLGCWVTEWSRPEAQIPGMQKMLRENTVHDLWFCSDCGVPGFSEMPLIGRA